MAPPNGHSVMTTLPTGDRSLSSSVLLAVGVAIPFLETLHPRFGDQSLTAPFPSLSQGSGPQEAPASYLLADQAGLWSAQWASCKLHPLVCSRKSEQAVKVTARNLSQPNVKSLTISSLIFGMQKAIEP